MEGLRHLQCCWNKVGFEISTALCPETGHVRGWRYFYRRNIDMENLTADFNLLRPLDELVFTVEYSYQDGNR